jgi:photosystem II stability/assembly factor-like uncharacterized protein
MGSAQGTGGTRDHASLLNRNVSGQHVAGSVGGLSPSSLNVEDIGSYWNNVGIAAGTIIRGITYLGNGIAIFGGGNGHIWRSVDYGLTWADLGNKYSASILFTFSYVGNGIVIGIGDSGRVIRSVDFGVNWVDLGSVTGTSTFCSASAGNIPGFGSGVVLIGDTNGHVWISTNNGLTYADTGNWTPGFIDSITYLDNRIVIFTDNAGHIFRSTNSGTTWTDLGDFSTSSAFGSVYLGNGVVLVSTGIGHILRSTDYGLTWTDLGSMSNAGSSVQTLAYLGNGVVVFGDFNGHLFKSTDYGVTWSDKGQVSLTVIRSIAYLGNGVTVLGDNNGAINRSSTSYKTDEARVTVHSDLVNRNIAGSHLSQSVGLIDSGGINYNDLGRNWTDLGLINTNGIGATISLRNGVVLVYTIAGNTLYRSSNYGRTFFSKLFPLAASVFSFSYLGNGIVLAGTTNGHIVRSTDFGINWTDIGVISAGAIFDLSYIGNGIVIFTDGTGNMHRSADYGITWPTTTLLAGAINTIANIYTDNGIILAGNNVGHVFRSTNYGVGAWTDIGDITGTGNSLLSMAYLTNGIVVAITNNGRVIRSTDYGISWRDLGDITGAGITLNVVRYLENGVVITGQNTATYRSTDYGLTWPSIGGMGVGPGTFNALSYQGNGVAIFGNSGHIWRTDVAAKADEATASVLDDLSNRKSELVGVLSSYSINSLDIGGTVGATTGNWKITTATGIAIICTSNIGSGIVLAGTSDGRIFKSTDHGKTFTDFLILSPTFPINSIEYCGYGIVLAADNQAIGHIFRSVDYGNSWTDEGAVDAFGSIVKIKHVGHGTVIFTDNVCAVWRSTDSGATWPVFIPIVASIANTAEYLDNGILIVGINNGQIYRTTNIDIAVPVFSLVSSLGTAIRCIQYLSSGIVIAGDNNGHIFRSTDFGANWTDLGDITGAAQIVITASYLGNGVAIVGVVAGAAGKIFKSTDYGTTWADLTPAGNVSATFFNTGTANYVGNGVSIIADNAGNIFKHDVSYNKQESVQNIQKFIKTTNTGITLEQDDFTVICDATVGGFTIFLPNATFGSGGQGLIFNIKKIDASINVVTVDAAGTQTIDGALTYPLNVQYQSVTVQSDGANWWVI